MVPTFSESSILSASCGRHRKGPPLPRATAPATTERDTRVVRTGNALTPRKRPHKGVQIIRPMARDNICKAAVMTTGPAVKLRFVILAMAMLLLSGFTQAELEKAKNTKEFFKDGYWKCLAT